MAPSRREDLNSHELRSTHFQGAYQDSNRNLISESSPRNQNAFGDDSDSEENHNQEDPGQPPEFDVYKDFNNSGVRYVTLLNPNKEQNASEEDLSHPTHPNDRPTRSEPNIIDSDKQHPQGYPLSYSNTPIATNTLKNNSKLESSAPLKSQRSRWQIGSIIAFLVVAGIATLVYFLAPRQPFISFEVPIAINSMNQMEGNNSDNNTKTFNASNPTDFSFNAQLSMALDGRGSYLPTLNRNFRVVINDLGSTPNSVTVANGQLNKGFTASSTKLTFLNVNVTFQYNARNSSDTLWQNWRKACGNVNQSTVNGTTTRPSLQLDVIISFNVIGMIGRRSDSTQLNNVACPIELPANAPLF